MEVSLDVQDIYTDTMYNDRLKSSWQEFLPKVTFGNFLLKF